MEEIIIKLEDVKFLYDKGKSAETQALKGISLEIQKGEYVSFFGPSGCGKSTTLYLMAGVEQAESGKIVVLGKNLAELSGAELTVFRQVAIGIVFQNFNLIPSISNLENVTLPMAFLGISLEKRRKRALELFDRLNISDLASRYPYELSGGQQQRVGIARALANDPPIILADEPIGNLDSANAVNVLDLLKEINRDEGKTIVMVTHESWSLRDVTKVFYMKDGSIIQTEPRTGAEDEAGKAKKLKGAYYYSKLFPELPPPEIQAKSLANLFLRGYTGSEVKRLEYFLGQRLKNEIDHDIFRNLLDRPYKDGGVGLWKKRAQKIADYVEEAINEEASIESLHKKMEKNPENSIQSEMEDIRRWLLEGHHSKLSPLQIDRFNEVLGERISNIITPYNFRRVLNLSKKSGGVGIPIRTSLQVSEKLETVLGQSN